MSPRVPFTRSNNNISNNYPADLFGSFSSSSTVLADHSSAIGDPYVGLVLVSVSCSMSPELLLDIVNSGGLTMVVGEGGILIRLSDSTTSSDYSVNFHHYLTTKVVLMTSH